MSVPMPAQGILLLKEKVAMSWWLHVMTFCHNWKSFEFAMSSTQTIVGMASDGHRYG